MLKFTPKEVEDLVVVRKNLPVYKIDLDSTKKAKKMN